MSEETPKIVLPPSTQKKMTQLHLGTTIEQSTYLSFAGALSPTNSEVERNRILLHLTSIGGDSSSALCIVDVLKAWPEDIVAISGGLTASAATYIIASADLRLAYSNSVFLFHPSVSGMEYKTKADFNSISRYLDGIDESYLKLYQECIGLTKKEAEKLLSYENYMNSYQALNLGTRGLIDGIILKLLDGFKYEILMRGGVRKVVDLANDNFNDVRNLTTEIVKNPNLVTG